MLHYSYVSIDLKSFYASVECIDRRLDPLTTHLVVADASRTQKTICLAVSPSLKAYGISGRPRLFEVTQKVREVNAARQRRAPGHRFTDKCCDDTLCKSTPSLELDFITATPRMARYIEYSSHVYEVYLKYIAPEDIHIYSIDEVFLDVTKYLKSYQQTARELAATILKDVVRTTGITATAGIGSNLYLAKVAMDIMAKKIPVDADGVRIAEFNEISYRQELWTHQPLTDFWRVGRGYARKLERLGLRTMGDIARFSLKYEDVLFRMFGVNAELLIDHAWGVEPCTMADIKAYRPASRSMGAGQVLHSPYTSDKARLVVHEMTDSLSMDLVERGLVCSQIVLTVGYDCLGADSAYKGEVHVDAYGRRIPKHAHGTVNLAEYTSSTKAMTEAVLGLYDRIINAELLVRRVNMAACNILSEQDAPRPALRQLSLFADTAGPAQEEAEQSREREKRQQEVLLQIRKAYGKNAILKGMNFQDGATTRDRNQQIGGHKA